MRRKCVYAMEKGLLGVMYWEHAADTTRELLGVIDAALRSTEPRERRPIVSS